MYHHVFLKEISISILIPVKSLHKKTLILENSRTASGVKDAFKTQGSVLQELNGCLSSTITYFIMFIF